MDYDNPLYSTGILMDRDAFKKLQQMLGQKYKIENDTDLMKLAEVRGEDLQVEIQDKMKESKKGNRSEET